MTCDPMFSLEGRPVGREHPAFLVAEIGQAHDGSLGMAHAYVDAAAEGGADAVKFQTHIAEAESTLDEPFRIRLTGGDATRFDYWKRMEFLPDQWEGLARHAREKNLVFLSSAFSVAAVELLRKLEIPAWKVGSGETRSEELLRSMCETGAPILLSTGMSTFAEIDEAVRRIEAHGTPYAVLQCTSRYPTRLEEVGLNVIDQLRDRFDCPVGLSDHSGSVFPGLTAMARGVDLLEVHLTIDRRLYGPDTVASVSVEELRLLSRARDAIATMDASPVNKDGIAEALSEMRGIFGKSVAPVRPLAAGTVLASGMLTMKKPGTGIPGSQLACLEGRRLARAVIPERLLTWDDIENHG